jgi:hypothetical protein
MKYVKIFTRGHKIADREVVKKCVQQEQVGAPTVPSAVIWGSNELEDLWCHKSVIVSHCVKK